MSEAALATSGEGSMAAPPHPRDVRALRVRLGAPMELLAKTAGYSTKRSWWLAELGKTELAPWRWQKVLEAAERGELAREGREAGRTRPGPAPTVHVDELLWVSDARRVEVVGAVGTLMSHLDVSASGLAEMTGMSHRMIALLLSGKARKQTTSARIADIRAALWVVMEQAGEAVRVFKAESRHSTDALRALRIGLRVNQETAGAWASPGSAAPSALMSAYECGAVRMSSEASTRLVDQLLARYQLAADSPAWAVLENPAGESVRKN